MLVAFETNATKFRSAEMEVCPLAPLLTLSVVVTEINVTSLTTGSARALEAKRRGVTEKRIRCEANREMRWRSD